MANLFEVLIPFLGPIIFVFGGLLGSFANVVIYRLPKGESVVSPRSRCPHCSEMIRWYQNIPIISWVVLRGSCGFCRKPISWRYPLVELIMALLFWGLYLKVGLNWLLLELLIFGFSLVVVSFIDFDHMILPDVFTLSGIVIGLIGAFLNPSREFLPALLGVFFGGGFLWAVAYLYFAIKKQDGMGGGDIKLLAWIGAVLGWKAIPFVILASSLVGSVVGLSLAFKKKSSLKTVIPFGPYLALAALAYVFGGKEIAEWYLGLFLIRPI